MKNFRYIKLICLSGILMLTTLTSCFDEAGTEIVFDDSKAVIEFADVAVAGGESVGIYLRQDDGQTVADQFTVNLVGAHRSSPVNFTIEVDASASTAIEGVHYNIVSGNTLSIAPGESSTTIDIEVFDDNIEPEESWRLVLNISSSDIPVSENYSSLIHNMSVSCPSNLGGLVDYTTTPWCGASAITGTVDLVPASDKTYTVVDVNNNDLEDFSFGAYYACYGAGATLPGGDLQIQDVCGTLSAIGIDRWGDSYIYNDVSVSADGSELTIDWINTYGEAGITVLTRQDGNPWPLFLKN